MSIVTFSQDSNILSPDVSVIIPTYNRISMLEEALASIISQQFDGVVEVIVVDDNSQDGTSEIINQKYPFVHLISLKQNLGPSAARNRAILEARGNYIAFLDSDDLWAANHLRTQIATIKGKERCFCVSDLVVWDTAKDCKRLQLQRPDPENYTSPIHHFFVTGFIITLSSVVIPRQAFDEVGLFDENFMLGEDNEMYLRCLLYDYNIVCTEQPTVIKRKHGRDQLTDNKNLKIKEKCRFMRINKLYPLTKGRFDMVPSRRIYAEAHAHFASRYFRNNDFLNWLTSSIGVAHNASPGYALLNMVRDIKHRTLYRLHRLLLDLDSYRVIKRDRKYITFINPIPQKGIDVATEIARRMPQERFLFVKGKWSHYNKSKLETFMKPIYTLPNMEVWNHQWDMHRVYAVTDILLVPSQLTETFGQVIVEAKVNGIPVIAANVSDIPYTLRQADMLVEPKDDPQAYINALQQLRTLRESDAVQFLSHSVDKPVSKE